MHSEIPMHSTHHKEKNEMEVGGLGTPEIIVVLIVILLVTAVPMAGIVALVLLFARRSKNSNAGMKKCPFCAMSIEADARVCRFCGRELAQ
jgi:hypothetical protein